MSKLQGLFLDDIRDTDYLRSRGNHRFKFTDTNVDWVVVRTVVEAIKETEKRQGVPWDVISFDHDLGDNAPGGDAPEFAKWLVEKHLDGEIDASQVKIQIHSANPFAYLNIAKKFDKLPPFEYGIKVSSDY